MSVRDAERRAGALVDRLDALAAEVDELETRLAGVDDDAHSALEDGDELVAQMDGAKASAFADECQAWSGRMAVSGEERARLVAQTTVMLGVSPPSESAPAEPPAYAPLRNPIVSALTEAAVARGAEPDRAMYEAAEERARAAIGRAERVPAPARGGAPLGDTRAFLAWLREWFGSHRRPDRTGPDPRQRERENERERQSE